MSLTPEQIDNLAEETRQRWEIPGLALTVIQKDEEAYVRGYGVRERKSNKLVDAQTLFQINSLTKAFTAATVDLLVKDGKLNWDLPISSYFPDFHSQDPQITERLSLRDLLCHRSGLPGSLHEGWRLFRNTNRPVDDLMRRLAFIDPPFPLRSRFNYDNIGYAIAGKAVANVSGIPWGDFCHQNIFLPLRMDRSFISYSIFSTDKNSALPHAYQIIQPIAGYNWEKDSLEAASGIHSCAQDMTLWLRCCLEDGLNFEEIFKPHIAIEAEGLVSQSELPTFEIISHGQPHLFYALGWWLYELENITIYRHTGSSSGMQSALAMVPEKKLGIAILSNQSKHPAVSALMNQLLDGLLERPAVNWQQQASIAFSKTQENEKSWLEKHLLTRKKDTLPSLPLEKYAGKYTHLGYGSILVTETDTRLEIKLLCPHEKGGLEHWESNRFEITDTPSGSLRPFLCEFLITPEGDRVLGLKINEMGIFERVS